MIDNTYNVLFVCTGNSARSIFAEALLNHWGIGRFNAYSAGSHPQGTIHPMTIELLNNLNFVTDNLHSKPVKTYQGNQDIQFDFVFTVCDNAAQETCPVWPGQPMTAHWGVSDPAKFKGDDVQKMLAFRRTFSELENRIKIFVNLPLEKLDNHKLQNELDQIGRINLESEILDSLVDMLDHAKVGITISDTSQGQHSIVYANQGLSNLFGFHSHEIIGKDLFFLHRENRHQQGMGKIKQAIQNQKTETARLESYTKSGKQLFCEMTVKPIIDYHNQSLKYYFSLYKQIEASR